MAADLLLETLEDLIDDDFDAFKWRLRNDVDFILISRAFLEDAKRRNTVTKMIETYGEEMAVNNAAKVLKKMGNNNAAEKLKNRYAAGGNTAAQSTSTSAVAPPAPPVAPPAAPVATPAAPVATPAAPAPMMAQDGSIIIVPNITDLLLETLKDLIKNDFNNFKWWLGIGVDFKPISQEFLKSANQKDTVTKMIETYGEEMAVKNAVDVLKEMSNNEDAEKLKNRYAAGGDTAAPSTSAAAPPAAPASMMAQQGSNIAPNVAGGTNITK